MEKLSLLPTVQNLAAKASLVSGLEAIDIVVSDGGLSDEWQQIILDAGPRLILADPPEDGDTDTSFASSHG